MNLPSDIATCHKLILELQNQVALLSSKLLELEGRINKNSQNSNKPPSSDGLNKPSVTKPAFPRKKGKQSGGQKGHKGKTLEFSTSVDYVHLLLPDSCKCGTPLDKATAQLVEQRQVFDLPEPKLEVTEYQKLGCSCAKCGTYNEGAFPEAVKARVQYGFGVKTLVVLLNAAFKLPIKKIQTLFTDLYGFSINGSTIISSTIKCYDNLQSSEERIKQSILEQQVAHFDETGLRVAGKLHWLHTACTSLYTFLFVHDKRGQQALQSSDSILPAFNNWAVHDCWSSYFNFTQCLHAICGAHLLRELTALQENGTQWATLFKSYLLALYDLSDKGKKAIGHQEQQNALLLFDQICHYADKEEPPAIKVIPGRGKPKATKGRNLLARLKKHQTAVLAFAFQAPVPFTNNQAERDLRPAKTKQKVSGCFRTLDGAKIYARILGFVSTTRKQQFSIFKELKNAFSGNTFLTHSHPS